MKNTVIWENNEIIIDDGGYYLKVIAPDTVLEIPVSGGGFFPVRPSAQIAASKLEDDRLVELMQHDANVRRAELRSRA